MYFNSDNNFFHGIMFHHFHDGEVHKKSQGSISRDEFYKMIIFIGRNNILNADKFYEKLKDNKLKENEVCLTFDDAIKCQMDIAIPVLEDLKIKSFVFIYTSIFEEKPDNLEAFRYFRCNYFNHVNEFYDNFYKFLHKDTKNFFKNNNEKIKKIKINHSFYSIEDIKFRFVRDYLIDKNHYEEIMLLMMKEKKFDFKGFYHTVYFDKSDIRKLDSLGHTIGLHSHNHPTVIQKLSYDEQKSEYEQNLYKISKLLNKPIDKILSMSHPCGNYNDDTLKVLKELGIEIGFKSTMTMEKENKKINNSPLEIAREDHSKILKIMHR
tara:strand:- start:998 stop:1963 length:966 start_codon:yes stop_codon:yes gene_type:complete